MKGLALPQRQRKPKVVLSRRKRAALVLGPKDAPLVSTLRCRLSCEKVRLPFTATSKEEFQAGFNFTPTWSKRVSSSGMQVSMSASGELQLSSANARVRQYTAMHRKSIHQDGVSPGHDFYKERFDTLA